MKISKRRSFSQFQIRIAADALNLGEALMELTLLMHEDGFRVLGGGAFCMRHVFSDTLENGRPDEHDILEAREYGRLLAEKVRLLTEISGKRICL